MIPTREVAWNAGQIGIAAMYLLVIVQALLLAYMGTKRYRQWKTGQPVGKLGEVGKRVRETLAVVFLHKRLIRRGYIFDGLMHLFIFWGFLMLFIGTLIVLLEADIMRPYFGISFYQGDFYVGYKVVINFFGLLFVTGLLMAIWRRYGRSLPKFRKSLSDDAIVLGLLLWLGVSGFLLQALRLAATQDAHAGIHWVSYPFATAMWNVDGGVLQASHSAMWWAHMLSNTALIVYIPVSKLFHMFTAPASVFLHAPDPIWAIKGIENIEEQEHYGADKLADFNWKQLENVDACMRCGRCLDFCPTFNTDKALKPRQLVIEVSGFMAREGGMLAGVAGPNAKEAGVLGSEMTSPDQPNLSLVPNLARLIGGVVSEDEIWDCTTCRACMEQCPVLIEHVPLITEMRRNLVLEQSQFPSELQGLFNNLERNGNPYSYPASTRADWAKPLGVPMMSDADPAEIEVVYWVGCMSSFDPRNRKVSEALVKVMNAAGVKFAILGKEENCCGDPARKAGNEYLYQILAQGNIDTLNGYRPKRIVASCPHCFNTIKNEYPELGGRFDVVSHSELIGELIDSGRLKVSSDATKAPDGFAYHDPCYLGRYNKVYEAPRQLLIQIEGSYKEMPRHHDQGFCCGAGGARAFMEEKRGSRISHNRLNEAMETKASGVAVACPFCITMFEDGVKGLDREDFTVKDVAELVSEALDRQSAPTS